MSVLPEVFVTFDDRFKRRVGQTDDLVGHGQLGRLEPFGGTRPFLTGFARQPGRSFERTGRDQGSSSQTPQAGDFIAELPDDLLLLPDDVRQLPHQGGGLGFRNVRQR
jgi:hypothetical protein